MLRLTLRSGRDGKLLARVVERDGVLFVLDFGDPAVLSDASRRVLHGGFTVDWEGSVQSALPNTPALLRQLALYYAAQGVLVFVDEPDFPRIAVPPSSPDLGPVPLGDGPPTLLPDETWEGDSNTELRSLADLRSLQDRIDATLNTGPQMPVAEIEIDGDEEHPTDEVTRLKPSGQRSE